MSYADYVKKNGYAKTEKKKNDEKNESPSKMTYAEYVKKNGYAKSNEASSKTESTVSPQEWAKSKKTKTTVPSKAETKPTQTEALNKLGYVNNNPTVKPQNEYYKTKDSDASSLRLDSKYVARNEDTVTLEFGKTSDIRETMSKIDTNEKNDIVTKNYTKDDLQAYVWNKTGKEYEGLDDDVIALLDDINAEEKAKEDMGFATASQMLGGQSAASAYTERAMAREKSNVAKAKLEEMGYNKDEIKYLSNYRRQITNAETAQGVSEVIREETKEHPVLGTALSFATNLASPMGMIETAKAKINGVPVDPNSRFFGATQMTSDIRGQVIEDNDWNIKINGKEHDVFDSLYGIGTSTADSIIAATVMPGLGIANTSANFVVKALTSAANGILGGALIGSQAATSTIQDVARRGGTTDEAISAGVVSFLAETLSEAWSIGNFKGLKESGKRGLKNLAKDLLKTAGVNASEEAITEVVNIVYDRYALGNKSNYELAVREFMQMQKEDGSYYTREEAESMAWDAMVSQVVEAAVSGAFQGVLMGSVGSVSGRIATRAEDKEMGQLIRESEMTEDVINVTKNNEHNDKYVKEWAKRITKSEKKNGEGNVPDHILGGAFRAMAEAESKNRKEDTTETKQTEEITPEQRVEMVRPTLERKDGKVVSVESVESVEDGKITVKGTDGKSRVLDTSKLSKQAQELWTYAAEHFTDAETVQAFVDGYEGSDIATYSRVFKATNDLAATGMSATDIQKRNMIDTSVLGEKAFSSAVETGNRAINKKIGVVDRTTVPKTNTQKLTIKMMDTFSKKHGMNIVVVDTLGTTEGWYKASTNSMVIALDSSAGAISRVFGHETYHYVKSQDKVRAKQIEEFVIDTMTRLKGKEWVDSKINSYDDSVYDTYELKVDEFVADQMFDVFNNERAVKEFVQKDMNFAQRVIAHIKSLIADIKNIYNNLIARGHDEISVWQKDIDALQKLNDMMLDALSSIEQRNALNTQEQQIADAFGDELGTIETNSDGDATLITNEDNSVVAYSQVTWENGGKADLEKALKRNGYNASEVSEIIDSVDTISGFLGDMAKHYADNHGYTLLGEHLVTDVTMDVKNGKMVLHSIVNNGDYPVNIDLALNCKKRIAYMRVMRDLINNGVFESVKYNGDAIAKVNEILRKNGFETACLGCFVESRRLQFQAWAETIVQEWNDAVDKYDKNAKYFGYAKVQKGASALTEEEIIAIDNELSSAKKNDQGNVSLGQGAVATKMARLLKMSPTLRRKITVSDLLTPEGLTNLRRENPNLFSLVKSRYGAASPKIVQDYNPYSGEMANLTFARVKDITHNTIKGSSDYIKEAEEQLADSKPVQPKKMNTTEYKNTKEYIEWDEKVQTLAMRNYLYDIGGARAQSFSDFMIENVFDYVQIFADLAANKFPLHTYTKEIVMMRLFGMTGAKINGSLISHTDKAFDSKYAGLLPASEAENGNAILVHTEEGDFAIGFDDYSRYSSTKGTENETYIQSIGYKDIIALMLDKRYSPYVGNITIGVSDLHIKAMLDSPLFRMVIPYHSSGMLPQFAKLVGVDKYNDYTNYQNTTVKQCYDVNGKPVSRFKKGKNDLAIDTSYPFNAELQKVKDPKVAANNYIEWCAEMHPVYDGKTFVGYATFSPKFSDSPYGTDFSKHPNYYKLLEDFDVYDSVTEEYAEQGAVNLVFPSAENRLSETELAEYRKALADTGVFSAEEIEKYVVKANMTFEEIIKSELDNRSLYESSQSKKYESTLQEISDALVKEYPRSGQISSYKEFAKTLKEGTTKQKEEQKGKLPLPGTYDTTAGEDDVWYAKKRLTNTSPLSYNDRAKPNPRSSINWVYEAELFSVVENKLFHQKISEINQGSNAFKKNADGEYMLSIENKIVFTDGNYNYPTITKVIELMSDAQTDIYDIRKVIFDVEKGESSYKESARTVQLLYGNRFVIQYNERDSRAYGWTDGQQKGRNRKAVIKHYQKMQNGAGNASQSQTNQSVIPSTKRDPSISEDASNYILNTKEYQEVLSILDERMNLVAHKNLSPKAINYLAGKLLNKVKSNYSREQLTERLTALFDYIANSRDVSWEEITEIAAQISKDVLKQSSVLDRSMQKEYADVLKLMKETKVYISPEQKAEIKMLYGSYDAFRRLVGNKIGVTVTDTSAVPLDVFWRELSENRPEMFNAETNYLDMPAELVTLFEMTSPQYVNPYDGVEMDMDEASYDMALQIYDEYFNIPEVKTEAQKYALKEERLKGRYNAKIKDIHNTYRERIKKLRKEKNNKIEATKALYRQRHEDYRDKRNETDEKQKLRRQIVRETKKLTDMLINPKDDKHIPQELIIGINSFARAMTEHGAFPAQKAVNLQKAFKNIGEKANDPDFNLASMYDESIDEMLGNLSSILSDKRLGEMTVIELSQIKDIAKYFSHIVSVSNKAFSENIRENLSTLQTETLNEVESQSKDKKRMMTKMQVGLLKPVTFFELLESPTLDKLYTNIRKGEESWAKTVYDAKQKRIEAQKEYNYKEWADDKVEITTEREDRLSLTVKEALSIYALSKRNQGVDHIMVGGIVLEEEARKRLNKKNRFSKNKDKSVNVRSANVPLSFNDIQSVNSMLTDEQKAYADELVKYMSSDMAKLGNEVSMRLYGIQKYTENYYFPIKSASNFLYSEPGVENDSRIKHMSMTKRTVPKANNPVIIGDFTETVMSHCQDMALYYGFALPLEDFKRVWNYKTPNIEGETHTSVKQQIDMVYGDKANKYIKQLLTDINGGVTKQAGADVVNKLIGLAKKNAVFASLSVAVQQPSAIARAMTYVDPKYFVGLHHKGTWEEIQKYAPVAIVKEMGYFDTGIGRQAVEWMTDTEYEGLKEKAEAFFKDGNFRDELMSMLPGYMDKISWGRLWVAVKNETKAKHTDLDVNSEEFLQACGERFTYVIDRTQVYDSVFSRSEWMRSKDTGVKVATAFMSEPLTAYNMLYKAAVESKKGNHKFAVRTLSAYVISVVFNSLFKSIITAMRDDDEEKSFWEKYIADFISNASDDMFGMIPYVKDVISILQGYESSRMDTQLFSNIADSVTLMFDSNKSPWEKVKTILGTVGMATGIPFKNAIRDAEMIVGGAKRVLDGNYKKTTATGIKYAIAEEYDVDKLKLYKTPTLTQQTLDAYVKGDTSHFKKQRESMLEKYGGDESVVNTQLKIVLKKGYLEGDYTKNQVKRVMSKVLDMDSNEIYWTLDEWDTPLKDDESYSKYDDWDAAVSSGSNIAGVAKSYNAYGVDKKALKSRITSKFKEEYVRLYKTNPAQAKVLKQKLLNAYVVLGDNRKEKEKDIDKWVK